MIQLGLIGFGEFPFFSLVLFHIAQLPEPPDWLYLLAMDFITLSISSIPLVQLIMNKQFRQIITQYFHQPTLHLMIGRDHRRVLQT